MPRRKPLSGAEANFRQFYLATKRSAKRRKLPFSLSKARFRKLTSGPCFFCGYPPSKEYRHSLKRKCYSEPYVFHGVDRFDNDRGYVEGNVNTCCWLCNRAKGNLTVEQFLLYAYQLYQHSIKPALMEAFPYVDEEHE